MGGPEWLRVLRRGALQRAESSSLPSAEEPIWRYSRVADLDLARFTLAAADSAGHGAARGLPAPVSALLAQIGDRSGLVVIHNGRLVPTADAGVPGLRVSWAGEDAVAVGEVAGEPDVFATLNAAFCSGPLDIHVAAGATIADPIVVLHWVDEADLAVFPRTVIHVGDDADARVLEIVASSDVTALVVPVTEMDLAPAARLGYLNVQVLGPAAWQIGIQASRVDRQADLVSQSVAFGGDYARVRTESTLVGAGASSRLLAVYFGDGSQMHDFRTIQAHAAPKTTSDLVFKGAVAGTAHSVYTGLIRVDKGSAGSAAFQTNRNLILHEGAHADSVPNLEIEEHDVRCSHASAVGPVDEEQRFYLESRGVPPLVADRLITLGFLNDVLARTPVAAALPWMQATLAAHFDAAEVGAA